MVVCIVLFDAVGGLLHENGEELLGCLSFGVGKEEVGEGAEGEGIDLSLPALQLEEARDGRAVCLEGVKDAVHRLDAGRAPAVLHGVEVAFGGAGAGAATAPAPPALSRGIGADSAPADRFR